MTYLNLAKVSLMMMMMIIIIIIYLISVHLQVSLMRLRYSTGLQFSLGQDRQRNIAARSRNHCCCGKAIYIPYSVCVCMQHAKFDI